MRSIKSFNRDGENEIKKDLADKYDGLSENELMNELLTAVSTAKSDGSFSSDQLDEFIGFVTPSLDEQSLKRLKELVNLIKNT